MEENKKPNQSFDEFLYGKEFVKTKKSFFDELHQIEQKYLEYFKSRPGRSTSSEYDQLLDHWIFSHSADVTGFKQIAESDLRGDIARECIQAFKKWFP